jgi:hypothetical protein
MLLNLSPPMGFKHSVLEMGKGEKKAKQEMAAGLEELLQVGRMHAPTACTAVIAIQFFRSNTLSPSLTYHHIKCAHCSEGVRGRVGGG